MEDTSLGTLNRNWTDLTAKHDAEKKKILPDIYSLASH